jgi:putative hemolysin
MAKNINIIVKDAADNPTYGAKVYIGTSGGSLLYAANKGAYTDMDGKAALSVGSLFTTQYVWVKDSNQGYESKQLYRSSKSTPYTFIIPKKTQQLVETNVIRDKSNAEKNCISQGGTFIRPVRNQDGTVTPSQCKLPKDKGLKTWHLILIGVGVLILVGGAVYYDQKVKK